MTASECELCAEGYARVESVVLADMPDGHCAIACSVRGAGHVVPRERAERIVAARLAAPAEREGGQDAG